MNRINSKKRAFIFGFMLGILLTATFYVFAWTEPSQSPPGGGGILYTQAQDIRLGEKNLWIENGKLIVGTNSNPKGIEMYDTQNGQKNCLKIINGVINVANGECS